MNLFNTIVILSASFASLASAQISQQNTAVIPSTAPNIVINRTSETLNGIVVFGTEGKQILRNGAIFRDFSRKELRANVQAPIHNQVFDEDAFRLSGDYAAEDIVYKQFVYFRENDNLVPAIRLQMFDGRLTRTIVVEQATHRVLLDRDETSHANCSCERVDKRFHYQHAFPVDMPDVQFQFWADDNPSPSTFHPTGVPDGFQAPFLTHGFRGNEQNHASPMGWVADSDQLATIGNNITAYTEGGNSGQYEDGPVFGTPYTDYIRFAPYYRMDYDWNSAQFLTLQAAAVNAFVHSNQLHDWYYDFGFDEASGNFQQNNFGRGGENNDSMLVVAVYHPLYSNNAFFSGTEIDGTPATMYLLRFAQAQNGNDRHSGFDSRIIAHEYQHGVTRRLVGPMSFDQADSLNEGWSDFAAYIYTLEPSDDWRNETMAIGDWLTFNINSSSFEENYYFGIRHMPITWDFNRNPMTYADTDPSQWNIEEGTPQSTRPLYATPHTFGQLWTLSLWDVFVLLNDVYDFEDSRTLVMETMIEGLRICPPEPTFNEARDSFIAADELLSDGENRVAIWQAFARRGLGSDAVSADRRTLEGAIESFEEPDWGDFDQDGHKNFFDVSMFIEAFIRESRKADLNWDGIFDLDDVNLFISQF